VGNIDGNFENAGLEHAGSGDQPIPKGHTFFLTPEEVLQARHEVDRLRKSAAKPDGATTEEDAIMPGLFLPNYIYDGCNTRFLAAGEQNKKTKASIFSDTGLMALVCCHDRPLFLVNLKDAGEKQYNAIALVNRLFKELPPSWRVGLLYDIGCQIHRSIVKVSPLQLHDLIANKLTALSITSFLHIPAELHGLFLYSMHLGMISHAKQYIIHKNATALGFLMGRAVSESGHPFRS
jgi:hypothetical protein